MTSLTPAELNEFRSLYADESRAWDHLNNGAASTLNTENEQAWMSAANRKVAFLRARNIDGMFVSLRDGHVSPRE